MPTVRGERVTTKKTAQEIWDDICIEIRKQISEESFDLWVRPARALSLSDGIFRIEVPNKFFADWMRQHLHQTVEKSVAAQAGIPLALEYSMGQELASVLKKPEGEIHPVPLPEEESSFSEQQFNPKYTFETFVVGPSNRFAQAASEAVAKEPGKTYNPLFIYGGVGLGKTHLMHAIGREIKRRNPRERVLYITSEKFINEFIDGIRFERMPAFRSKYRNLDCLLIDDIQFMLGKDSSQEEFFYTFNTLYDSRKQIVVSSDRSPKETQVSDRLVSRLEWGVIADIKPPDLETRIAILRKKAETERIYVPDDVILFIAGQIKANIRELEGSLIRIVAHSSLTGSEISVDRAREILKDIITREKDVAPITLDKIIKVTGGNYHLDVKDIKSKRRTDAIAFPRQIAMYLARTLTEHSTTAIGEFFGGRDHTTVIHACEKIKGKLQSEPYFVALLNKMAQEIRNGE